MSRDFPINRIASCAARRTLGTLPVNDNELSEICLDRVVEEEAAVAGANVKDSMSILSLSTSNMAESKA